MIQNNHFNQMLINTRLLPNREKTPPFLINEARVFLRHADSSREIHVNNDC